MPQTKFQGVIFSLMMVFCMVFCMTFYTIALSSGSLSPDIFPLALKEMWPEYAIVFVLVFFFISKLAQRLAFRIFNPKEDKKVFVMLAIQSFTVVLAVPSITLIATFIHGGFTSDWFCKWITTAVLCFPMAFFPQIFFAGPLVRFLFRLIFARQLSSHSA